MTFDAFHADAAGLRFALERLLNPAVGSETVHALPAMLPAEGIGAERALRELAPALLAQAADLGGPAGFAHMDPPTPWISWAVTLWTASRNQNLLHWSIPEDVGGNIPEPTIIALLGLGLAGLVYQSRKQIKAA